MWLLRAPTFVTIGIPSKKQRKHRKAMNSSLRRFSSRGYSSTRPVTTASNIANWVSRPSVNSMKKNITAQNGEMGIWAIPSGYTTKARPGPEVATSETSLPETCAMKPSTLKMTKPANTLVLQFMIDTIMASLNSNKINKPISFSDGHKLKFLVYHVDVVDCSRVTISLQTNISLETFV